MTIVMVVAKLQASVTVSETKLTVAIEKVINSNSNESGRKKSTASKAE